MKSLVAAAAILMMSAAFTVPALAQSAFMTTEHSMRASKLVGVTVVDGHKDTIGTIDDILVPASGAAPEAVVNVGSYVGGGDKLVLIPVSHLRFSGSGATMLASKAQLTAMKAFSYHMASDSAG